MNFALSAKQKQLLVVILALVLILGITCCSKKETPAEFDPMGTVAADNLNVRKKHDPDSKILGRLPAGLEIEILEQKVVGDITWGRIDPQTLPNGTEIKGGWINLQYVKFGVEPEPEVTEPPTEPPTEPEPELPTVPSTMGTITTGKLNIRKGAGSKYDSVGSYVQGDRVEIIETSTVDDTLWGHTSKGWVAMSFVRMDGSAPTETNANLKTDGKLGILGYGVVDLGSLNVRLGPGTEYDKVKAIEGGARYAYYQVDGTWVRIEDGWVSTEYFYLEGSKASDGFSGTINTDELKIRTGPSTSYKVAGTYKKGEKVEVLGQIDKWCYTAKGWISTQYVDVVYNKGLGTVTTGLNIRKEPNGDSQSMGTYQEGDVVEILEVQGTWGKTTIGWINLKYVQYK